MKNRLNKNVFVFDLDDTLYKEFDYKKSGIYEICKTVNALYGSNLDPKSIFQYDAENDDFIGEICNILSLPKSVKESLLWMYRNHNPKIELENGLLNLLDKLNEFGFVLLLTDGRSVTQRLKIKALKLDHFPCFISEEWGAPKPDPRRFLQIMDLYSAHKYFYIADNINKDFLAPNRLGWITVGLLGCSHNIHVSNMSMMGEEYLPSVWINSLLEMSSYAR